MNQIFNKLQKTNAVHKIKKNLRKLCLASLQKKFNKIKN